MQVDSERKTYASNRRGFLRGLTTLPLIGGSVALIGVPTAVAELASMDLMIQYETWLAIEIARVASEVRPGDPPNMHWRAHGPAFEWHGGAGFRYRAPLPPSTRAALVLATVGCDWREGGR